MKVAIPNKFFINNVRKSTKYELIMQFKPSTMNIRAVTPNDAKSICDIYNHYVENTAVTFETSPVTEAEMRRRIASFLEDGSLYFVAEMDDKVVGYCYLHNWNNRCAYSTTKEVSVYLDKEVRGKGIGTVLYRQLFKRIYTDKAIHTLIAGICIPNEESVHLHEKFGFRQVSKMVEIGRKFDQWHDVGHWQLLVDKVPPRILILCTGNSCRSQMAHGFLQSFDPRLLVYSAGTQPAGKINPHAVEVMADVGIDISHHRPESVATYMNDEWDYVITVCGGANESCPAFSGKVKNRLHIGFDDPSDAEGSPEFIRSEYIRVRNEIRAAFYELYCADINIILY
jgi:L-amino acid N-acyltransferase YncA/protein-tyrosine-phosphatase